MSSGMSSLTTAQRELLDAWLPGAQLARDHSWGLIGTFVLELHHNGVKYIAKAGDERDHHLAREIKAHREWLRPWTTQQRAPELVHADVAAKLLVTRYLEGELVQGSEHEWRPDTYRQAGELLAQLHQQVAYDDPLFEARQQAKSLTWLEGDHRIPAEVTARLRREIAAWPTPPVTVVPTHGDWQPRNWIVHDGVVSVIDFGRAELRPALTDFARLAAQQFRRDRTLEQAFLEGYGSDPRDPAGSHRHAVREAIGTACWAYEMGDTDFEQQGHRMLADVMASEHWTT